MKLQKQNTSRSCASSASSIHNIINGDREPPAYTDSSLAPSYQLIAPPAPTYQPDAPPAYTNDANIILIDSEKDFTLQDPSELEAIQLLSESSVIVIDDDDFYRLVSLPNRAEKTAYIWFIKANWDLSGYDGMTFVQLQGFLTTITPEEQWQYLQGIENEWIARKDPMRERRVRSGEFDDETGSVLRAPSARRMFPYTWAIKSLTLCLVGLGIIYLCSWIRDRKTS